MDTQLMREIIREADTFDTMLCSVQREVEERRNLLATVEVEVKRYRHYQSIYTRLVKERKGIIRIMGLLSELIGLVETGE